MFSSSTMSSDNGVVSYDRRSFAINGKPIIIISGSVHYIRVHPSRWARLFQTFLDAGLNTIETYLFWGHHDAPPAVDRCGDEHEKSYNFEERLDVFGFIAAAAQAGLYVILRLGPYVCAEVNYGGFPARLRDVPDIRFRTMNDAFLKEVESWIVHVAAALRSRKLLATQGGPVILFQLENEYSMVSHKYGEKGAQYLQWMADLQKKLSLNIPAIMCYGAAEGVVETINAFYAHNNISELRRSHPDQPPVWTECWTGWYDVWGAPHHERPVSDLLYAVARFFASSGSGVNYYMWMGGTNYGRETMYLQVTSYDYDAPIDEFYNHTTKSKRLAKLHKILTTTFASAFHETRIRDPSLTNGVCLWGTTAFLCNDSDKARNDFLLDGQAYPRTVAAQSVHIVDVQSGKLLFDTAEIPPEDVVTKRLEHTGKKSTPWVVINEPLFSRTSVLDVVKLGGSARPYVRDDSPPELVALTKGSSDYALYAAEFSVKRGPAVVEMEVGDFASVFIDGEYVGGTAGPLWEDRWPNRWNEYNEGFPGTCLKFEIPGLNRECVDVCVMVSSLGMVKGDWQLGERNMLEEKKGLLSDVKLEAVDGSWKGKRKSAWHGVGKLHGEVLGWGSKLGAPDGSNVEGSMESGSLEELKAPVWISSTIDVGDRSDYWVLDLEGVGKGMLFVNGVLLGRFWNVRGTRPRNGFLDGSPIRQLHDTEGPSQRYYHIPAWVGDKGAVGHGEVRLHVVLFVERGPVPQAPLSLFEMKSSNDDIVGYFR